MGMKLFLMLLFLVSFTAARSQSCEVSLRNDTLVDASHILVDVYVKSTWASGPFSYASGQYKITFNNAMRNGGTIFCSLVSGYSDLTNASQIPTAMAQPTSPTATFFRVLAQANPPDQASGSQISAAGIGTRICRISIFNSSNGTVGGTPVSFGQVLANLAPTAAAPTGSAVFYMSAANTAVLCSPLTMNATYLTNPTLNLAINTTYTLTGGSYCPGGSVNVILSGSETGVKYMLKKDGVATDPIKPGTGAALDFGTQTAGTYTVFAWRAAEYISNLFGPATVTANPASVGGTVTPAIISIGVGAPTGAMTLSGHTGTILNWQKQFNAGGYTDIPGTAGLTVYPGENLGTAGTYNYRAVVQSGTCASANSVQNQVTVTSGPQNAPITTAGSVSACPGTAITIPITVNAFTDITSVSLRLDYDAALMSFSSFANSNPLLTGILMNDVTTGVGTIRKIVIVWTSVTPLSLTYGSKLLDVNFNYISGAPTLAFNNTANGGQDCEYADLNGNPLPDTPTATYYFDATVTSLAPAAAGAITGPASVCQGAQGVAYSVAPIANATGYNWVLPLNANIATGGGTASITVNFATNAASGNITVNGTNACAAGGATSTLPVTVNASPVPTITTGPINICGIPSTGNVYTTQAGMSAYNWTTSAGGSVTAGQGTNSATITWSTAGAQWVTVTYSNASSCSGTSVQYNVTVTALPVPIVTGPTPCGTGSTGNVYTTEAGMTNYLWTVSGGGTITSGGGTSNNTVTVTWTTAGNQTVCVNYTNGGGCTATAPTCFPVVVSALPGPAGAITGPTTVCPNSDVTFSVAPISLATGYSWNVTGIGTITSTLPYTNTITVHIINTPVAGTVSVFGTNVSGNGTPSNLAVGVYTSPVPVITGPASACLNSTGNVYTTAAGMTNYVWSVSSGGVVTAGGGTSNNTMTVTWNTVGPQLVMVNYSNANGCRAITATVFNVTVNALPTPTFTTGPTSVCTGTTGNVYTTQSGMTSYVWTVSAGGTVTAGGTATSNTVTVTWNTAGAQTVCVNYNNANGCSAAAPVCTNVTVNPRPTPTITGPASACVGSTGNVYTTQTGMTGYTWTITGGTIVSGATTNSVTVTWNTAGAQSICVNYTNASLCSATAPVCYAVTVNALPVPTITGPNTACLGTTGLVYTTQTGMTNYTWTVTGGTITAGQGTNSVTVTWSTVGAQTVCVNYTNASLCTAAAPACYNVTVSTLPVPTITGLNSLCVNSGYYTYTTQTGMTNYAWSISAGGSITSGQGTSSVIVTWGTAGSQSISVTYTNAGGCTAAQPTVFPVTVNGVPGSAGTVTGSSVVCGGATGVAYSVTPISNVTTYVWTLPAGATIATGSGTNAITVNFAGDAVSGNVSVYGNSLCGNGLPSPDFPVTVNALPADPGTITGPASVCAPATGVSYSVGTVAGATGYSWTVPTGATVVSGGNTNSITVNFSAAAVSGDVTVHGTNTCGNGPTSTKAVTVTPTPAAPVVTATDTLLSSSIATGNQWYHDGTLITGATGQTYVATVSGWYWSVVTVNGCSSDTSNHVYVLITGINEIAANCAVSVYPNPSTGQFTLMISSERPQTLDISVINNLGVTVYEANNIEVTNILRKNIDLRNVASGVYSILLNNAGNHFVKKIMITR